MTLILGIDPGSHFTGYGVIRCEGSQHAYVTSGRIRIQGQTISERLRQIFTGLQEIVQTYQPAEAAIEQIFMHQYAGAALKLGQARGAAIVAVVNHAIPMAEYSARQVKQSVVGYGAAKKEQVQHMVRVLLNLTSAPQTDAADALAIAICHANSRQNLGKLSAQQITMRKGRFRRGRLR